MQFSGGYISADFVTDSDKRRTVLENPYILLYEKKLSSIQPLQPILDSVSQSGRPLLIIAEDVEGEALAALVDRKQRGTMKIAAVKAPSYGHRKKAILDDMSAMTAGELISEDLGIKLENVTLQMLGEARRAIITGTDTIIVDGAGSADAIRGRIEQIQAQMEIANADYERQYLMARIARLSGGIAIVNVGTTMETELVEKINRVEDALYATQAALEEGIAPGGGVAYIRSICNIDDIKAVNDDEQKGIGIVAKAIEEPLRQIVINSGVEADSVLQKVKEGEKDFGFNANTEVFENLLAAGVIDLTKALRIALENAAAITNILLTTECVISDEA